MPSLDDWIGKPLDITNRIYEQCSEIPSNVSMVQDYFRSKLETPEAVKLVPSLNDVPLHNLKTNSLVRFRCMVQDMFDPEYYLGSYEVKDVKLCKTSMHSGMWKDIADCGRHQEVLLDSAKNKTMDRQTLYCVTIPGENEWTKQTYYSQGQSSETPSTSSALRNKRSLDDDESTIENNKQTMRSNNCSQNINGQTNNLSNLNNGDANHAIETMEVESNVNEKEGGDVKKTKSSSSVDSTSKKSTSAMSLNFPLPDEKGPACLVKLYDSVDGFKVNELVEFIGILSNDPAMVDFPDDKRNEEQSTLINPAEIMMDSTEQQVHHPPPSLVPRLHVILANKLGHSNPHLPDKIDEETCKNDADVQELLLNSEEIRQKLLLLLKDALYGDILAAEYMLCHLISNVYARHDVTAMGKFSLNLKGCPKDVPFPFAFYQLLNKLLPKSHLISLTVANLNNAKFTPCKDYSANRLTSGQLQLSDNTELLVDETVMQPGQLDTNGVKNLTSIGNIITWQKVEYDFNYHKQDFPSNMPVLVMSEGKSLLACDCPLTLVPQVATITNIEEHMCKIQESLTPKILKTLQSYISLVQLMPYSLPEGIQQDMENDFVEIRKENPDSMSVEDFELLLVLARLVSKSYGKMGLSKGMWEKTKQLEHQRKLRMQSTATTA